MGAPDISFDISGGWVQLVLRQKEQGTVRGVGGKLLKRKVAIFFVKAEKKCFQTSVLSLLCVVPTRQGSNLDSKKIKK